MPRRVPLCAWCGGPLQKMQHRDFTFEDLPGRPRVAWHAHSRHPYCWVFDEVRVSMDRLLNDGGEHTRGIELLLEIIESRGEGRVVRNKVRRRA